MKQFWSVVGLVVAVGGAGAFLGSPAHSQTESKLSQWEYRTETVEPAQLTVRLNEWGNDRWEVFAVERADTVLAQDGGTRLKVENYQVTAKRRK